MEGGRNAKLCADKNNHSGQTWISIYVSPLSESSCKLLNRVVPNGTLRGVEGEDKISPIRLRSPVQKKYAAKAAHGARGE